MLHHHERKVLRRIEREFELRDPRLAARMRRTSQDVDAGGWKAVLVLVDITAVVMFAAGVFAGSGLLVYLGVLCITALIILHVNRRKSRRSSR